MIESRDLLFIVLALCAVWFTLFLCWFIYQAASLIKRVHGLVDEVKTKITNVEESVISMRRKFDGNLALVSGIAEGIKKIIESARNR